MTVSAATRNACAAVLENGSSLDFPPVVILNMFYSGLAIARQLHGKGMRVIGLSADRAIYGNFTRLCEVRRAPNSKDDPQGLREFLLQAADLQGAIIFPTRDADVIFLDRFRSDLEPRYRLAIPPAECLRRTIDKHQLARIALDAGIAVPRTLQLDSAAELDRVAEEVGFPCVVKPVSSFQWHQGDAWQRVGSRKAIRINDRKTLVSEYHEISQVTPQVLIQEWIPGGVDQIVVLGGYVGEDSELLSYFTARKILQSPDDCGTGCIVRSEPIDDIVEPTRTLFRALRYQGMAEVEYKYDARTGEYKLIEINTRHWDQHQLGDASGANLSWVAYCHLTGRSIPPAPESVAVATWIAEDALFLRLLRGIFHPNLRIPHLAAKISGPRMYAILAGGDPLPFLRYFCLTVLPDLPLQAARSIRGFLRSSS
jgi:predicted ATP-grasp superfamily ATP-dependent carboligase